VVSRASYHQCGQQADGSYRELDQWTSSYRFPHPLLLLPSLIRSSKIKLKSSNKELKFSAIQRPNCPSKKPKRAATINTVASAQVLALICLSLHRSRILSFLMSTYIGRRLGGMLHQLPHAIRSLSARVHLPCLR
jgi:hypothetical protein